MQSNDDWSGKEYAPNPNNAWNFNTNDGNQNNDNENNALYAVAVRPGGRCPVKLALRDALVDRSYEPNRSVCSSAQSCANSSPPTSATAWCRGYLRYCDDFVRVAESAAQLSKWQARIEDFLTERLLLQLNPARQRLRPVSDGVDFLGYIVRPFHLLVRRRVVGNLHEVLARSERALVSRHGPADAEAQAPRQGAAGRTDGAGAVPILAARVCRRSGADAGGRLRRAVAKAATQQRPGPHRHSCCRHEQFAHAPQDRLAASAAMSGRPSAPKSTFARPQTLRWRNARVVAAATDATARHFHSGFTRFD